MQIPSLGARLVALICFIPLCQSLISSIEQANPFKGQRNEITVNITLASLNEFSESVTFTISGLKYGNIGFATSNSQLNLSGIDGSWANATTGSWIQDSGTLLLPTINTQASGKLNYVIKFVLDNPTTATKFVADTDDYPLKNNPPILSVRMNQANMTFNMSIFGSGGRFNLTGERVPLTVVDPLMSIVAAQSSPLSCANNSLTLTLTLLITCYNGSSITLRGLKNTQQIPVNNQTGNPRLTLVSSDQINGIVVWQIVSSAWLPAPGANRSESVILNFTNPSTANTAPDLTVSGTCLPASGDNYTFAGAPVSSPTGSLLGIAKGFAPLTVVVASISDAKISQTSPLATAKNFLLVSFRSSVELDGSAQLIIRGLLFESVFSSTRFIPALSESEVARALSDAGLSTRDCDLGSGIAPIINTPPINVSGVGTGSVVTVSFLNVTAGSVVCLPLQVTNPAGSNTSDRPTITLSITSSHPAWLGACLPPPAVMVSRAEPLLGVPDGYYPFRFRPPCITSLDISMSTAEFLANNMITATLRANMDLPAGVVLTIRDLSHTSFLADTNMTVTVRLPAAGTSSQGLGTLFLFPPPPSPLPDLRYLDGALAFPLPARIPAGQAAIVSFTVVNQNRTQGRTGATGPGLFVRVSGTWGPAAGFGAGSVQVCPVRARMRPPYCLDPARRQLGVTNYSLNVKQLLPDGREQEVAGMKVGDVKDGLCDGYMLTRRQCGYSRNQDPWLRNASLDLVTQIAQEEFPSLSECRTALEYSCRLVNAGLFSTISSLFLPTRAQQASICCANTPRLPALGSDQRETMITLTPAGAGALGECQTDANCTRDSPFFLCCDYCQMFFGEMACADFSGVGPGAGHPDVVKFCRDKMDCRASDCYGDTTQNVAKPVVEAGGGGAVSLVDKDGRPTPYGVSLPPGALDPTETRPIRVSLAALVPTVRESVRLVGDPIVFQPSGLRFLAPVPVVLPYSPVSRRALAQAGGMVMVHKLVPDGVGLDGRPDPTRVRWQPVAPSQATPGVGGAGGQATCMVTGFSTLAALSLASHPSCTGTPAPKGCRYSFPHSRDSSAGVEVYLTLAALAFLWLMMLLAICLPVCCRGQKFLEPEEEEDAPAPEVAVEPLPISPPPPPAPIVFVREMEPERRFNENGSLIKHYGAPIHRKADPAAPAPAPP